MYEIGGGNVRSWVKLVIRLV